MNKKNFICVLVFSALCILIAGCSKKVNSRTWTPASGKGFAPRAWFTTSALGGKIYAIGGFGDSLLATTLDVYDPATDSWSTPATTGTFTPRGSLTSAVVDGKIYVMGGAIGPEKPSNMSNALEVFDPSSNSWSTPKTTGTFTPRNNLCACVIGEKIYTLGGYNAERPGDLNILEVFDPLTNTWSTPITSGTFTPHGAFTANVINGKIYAIGGFNDKGAKGHRVLSSVEVFDPATNAWSAPATSGTFTARLLHSSAVVDGRIYIIGGTPDMVNPLTSSTVQIFDPETNSWSTPEIKGKFTPRAYLSSCESGGKIYTIGGQDTATVFNTVEVFTPGK
jgi:N-acetylneuraminic acid mutarotase